MYKTKQLGLNLKMFEETMGGYTVNKIMSLLRCLTNGLLLEEKFLQKNAKNR